MFGCFQLLAKNMRTNCKCHGISGSCELRTCWRVMPYFRNVGDLLKIKFDSATEVRAKKRNLSKKIVPSNKNYKPFSETDLVYLTPSPNFCEADVNKGSLGTHGRLCNATSEGIDGCELLCCGRGHATYRRTIVKKCRCKFHWCCTVHCDTCKEQIEEYVCR